MGLVVAVHEGPGAGLFGLHNLPTDLILKVWGILLVRSGGGTGNGHTEVTATCSVRLQVVRLPAQIVK